MLQAQADSAQDSSALAVKTGAASGLNTKLERLRRELSPKQGEADQAAASGAAAAHHQAALQQQLMLQQQHLQQAEAELQKQLSSNAVLTGGEAQDQLGSPATTQPGQVSYFHKPSTYLLSVDTLQCLSVCACMHKSAPCDVTVIH